MNFAQWALRKPVLPLVLIALLSVLGLRALGHMPLTYLPDIGQNRIYLQLQTAPAALDDIEHALARPIEQALAGVPEISFVSSRIGTQAVHYTLGLNDSRMSQQVLGRVKDRLNGLVPQLPLAFEIADIRAASTRDMPMLELAILPRMGGLTDATMLVRRVVLPALHGIAGLSEVKQMGADQPGLSVHPVAGQLAAANLTLPEFTNQLRALLGGSPTGVLQTGPLAQAIVLGSARPGADLAHADALAGLPLQLPGGQTVPLGALARIKTTTTADEWVVRHDGQPALILQLNADPNADLHHMVQQIDDRLAQLQAQHPDIQFHVIDRPAQRAAAALGATQRALIEGSLLVIGVIALALRARRATALAALALPLSVLPTLFFMDVLGLSLNMVSLLALTLAAGILVDDAIVEIENIHKFGQKLGMGRRAIALAVRDIEAPVIATSCAILAVFLPLAAMSGEAGRYFWAFGATLCVASAVSLFVARMVLPPLALWLPMPDAALPNAALPAKNGGTRHGALRLYRRLVVRSIQYRWVALGLALVVVMASVIMAVRQPGAFIPQDEGRKMQVQLALPDTMPKAQREMHIARLNSAIAAVPGVVNVTTLLPVDGQIPPRLLVEIDGQPGTRNAVQDLLAKTIDMRALMLQPSGQPLLAFDLVANDTQTLQRGVDLVLAALSANRPAALLQPQPSGQRSYLEFQPNAAMLQHLGIAMRDVDAMLADLAGQNGAPLARLAQANGPALPVTVQLSEAHGLQTPQQWAQGLNFAHLRSAAGQMVPLASLGQFKMGSAQAQRMRRDGRYAHRIFAAPRNAAEAREIRKLAQATVANAQAKLPWLALLAAGDTALRQQMMQELGRATGTSLLLMMAVFVVFFRSGAMTAVILGSVLFALGGGMLPLVLTGMPLSLPVLLGLMLLMAIVSKNAILVIDRAQRLAKSGPITPQVVLRASTERARPIVMTSLAMIMGMLPAALASAEGAAFRQPLALSVICGVAVSTVLSLVLLPSLIVLADRAGRALRSKAAPRPRAAMQGRAQNSGTPVAAQP